MASPFKKKSSFYFYFYQSKCPFNHSADLLVKAEEAPCWYTDGRFISEVHRPSFLGIKAKVIGDFGKSKHERTHNAYFVGGQHIRCHLVMFAKCGWKDGFNGTCIPDQELLSHSSLNSWWPVVVMDNYSNLTGTTSNPFLACSQVIAITLWAMFVTIRILSRNFTITHVRESFPVKRRKKNWAHI